MSGTQGATDSLGLVTSIPTNNNEKAIATTSAC